MDLIDRQAAEEKLKTACEGVSEKLWEWEGCQSYCDAVESIEECLDDVPSAEPDTGMYTDGFNDGYKQAQKDARRWIPVTERLPEDNIMKEYLVSQRGCEWIALASYDDGWFDNEGTVVHERVTAWMPLPKPYKETPHD